MSMKRDKMVLASQSPRFNQAMTLREEIMGRKLFKGGSAGPSNLKSNAKMQHFQNLSLWACTEVALPPLNALFGRHFATCQEAAGMPRDPSLFQCERATPKVVEEEEEGGGHGGGLTGRGSSRDSRYLLRDHKCESILQPGYNCTVRVEKPRGKMRRKRKIPNVPSKNNVIYTCHFCSHRNQMRGTPRGHVEELIASKQKPDPESKSMSSIPSDNLPKISKTMNISRKTVETGSSKDGDFLSSKNSAVHQDCVNVIHDENSPQHRGKTLLLEGKKKKRRRSEAKNLQKTEDKTTLLDAGSSGSSRKKKKSWSSLREIAEKNEKEKREFIANLKVPFFLG
ncbi:hypothetical protein Scep_018672 [Stephania cephalantha]|uniref:Uncharacterized protein n=1 Tax=Stephania cephalantha TaxID=152367 RepID=A0AAP0I9Q4_9MAGN